MSFTLYLKDDTRIDLTEEESIVFKVIINSTIDKTINSIITSKIIFFSLMNNLLSFNQCSSSKDVLTILESLYNKRAILLYTNFSEELRKQDPVIGFGYDLMTIYLNNTKIRLSDELDREKSFPVDIGDNILIDDNELTVIGFGSSKGSITYDAKAIDGELVTFIRRKDIHKVIKKTNR